MSNVILFLTAALAGFIVAVPIGAIGAMCLRRALQGRWLIGLLTGFGAALADMLLAVAAIFGLTLLTQYFLDHQWPVRLVGGCFLIFIGIRMIIKRCPKIDSKENGSSQNSNPWRKRGSAVATGFALTIINPATLLAFVGVFAGLGLFQQTLGGLLQSWIVVLGAFVGSMLWWTTLTGVAYAVRRHLPLEIVIIVNVVLGVLVIGLGAASVLSAFGVGF